MHINRSSAEVRVIVFGPPLLASTAFGPGAVLARTGILASRGLKSVWFPGPGGEKGRQQEGLVEDSGSEDLGHELILLGRELLNSLVCRHADAVVSFAVTS